LCWHGEIISLTPPVPTFSVAFGIWCITDQQELGWLRRLADTHRGLVGIAFLNPTYGFFAPRWQVALPVSFAACALCLNLIKTGKADYCTLVRNASNRFN
jgi:hypothetical protein